MNKPSFNKYSYQLSIRGQAFGVGAFEEDDDDIYAREDLTTYDFSLEDKTNEMKSIKEKHHLNVVDGKFKFCINHELVLSDITF